MIRRAFVKNVLVTSSGFMLAPYFGKAGFFGRTDDSMALAKNFLNPPDSSKPWCFYMWMNGHITKAGITADLEAMKRMGIGGGICFNSAVGIPRGPIDYASEAWMDATLHTIKEANRLGLQFALHNSPGYSGCGGPWVTPEMSMQQLVWTETLVANSENINIQLPKPYAKQGYYRDACVLAYPSLPVEQYLMKGRLSKAFVNGLEIDKEIIADGNPETKVRLEMSGQKAILLLEFAEAFEARAITILRKPELPKDLFDGPRDHPPVYILENSDDGVNFQPIGTIPAPEMREMDTPVSFSFDRVKSRHYRLIATSPSWISDIQLHSGPRLAGWPGKTGYTHGNSGGVTPILPQELIIDHNTVVDITDWMDADGNLQWRPGLLGTGNITILRIGHTSTGEECAAHPDSGKGLELDKFRKEALDTHFSGFLDKVIERLKPHTGKAFKGITVDSWEAGKQNWTIGFPNAFKQKRGYDIAKWMPAMTGRIVGSVDDTERFLWDVRKTQADLLTENFYGYYAECCHKRGLEFYAEPYGDGNLDSLAIGKHLDIPMSEFWTRYIYGRDTYSKQAVSIAHAYGKPVVAAEAYTAMPATAKWMDYPYSLKAEGDYFFTLGVNRLTFHTFVHQPYMTGKPGMTMGPFGMHIDRNNTWTEQAYGWTKYIQRTQYLLQKGLAVVDVCYFKGDEPESGVPDISKILPDGYTADVIGSDVLHSRFKIQDHIIVLSDGMQYRICILAPVDAILLSSFAKIKELVFEGMTLVVSKKPLKALGKDAAENKLVEMVNDLYGGMDGVSISENSYGKGRVIWGGNIKKVFDKLDIRPDFTYSGINQDAVVHSIHKRIGNIEYYFIANHKRRKESIVCSFRIVRKQPEIWDGVTGDFFDAALYEQVNGRTVLPLELEPSGSFFIVFRRKTGREAFTSVLKDGEVAFSTTPFNTPNQAKYADVNANFSILLWAKPDSFTHGNKSMLFHAPEGQMLYGKGHSAIALNAGQNGIKLYERTLGNPKEVLVCDTSLQGWTHIGLVYCDNKPLLYINGKLAVEGTISGNIVHPGLDTLPEPSQYASYFEGNFTRPFLLHKTISEYDIGADFLKGLPAPSSPPAIALRMGENGGIKALVFQNGQYALKGKSAAQELRVKGCSVFEISGEWQVKFPTDSGAPTTITLPSLISLHRCTEFDVKYFSGTCIYVKTIHISKNNLGKSKQLFLDLGRVEVAAEVSINRQKISLLWKEPFIVDITNALRLGNNLLEIRVTNLWANRLIGDENLPIEDYFTKDNLLKKMPEWFLKNQPSPGQRKTFSTWHVYEKDSPLLESGLLGPVRLLTAIEAVV